MEPEGGCEDQGLGDEAAVDECEDTVVEAGVDRNGQPAGSGLDGGSERDAEHYRGEEPAPDPLQDQDEPGGCPPQLDTRMATRATTIRSRAMVTRLAAR